MGGGRHQEAATAGAPSLPASLLLPLLLPLPLPLLKLGQTDRGAAAAAQRGAACVGSPVSPVPLQASAIAAMQGRCPPGKMCSRMKSEEAQ